MTEEQFKEEVAARQAKQRGARTRPPAAAMTVRDVRSACVAVVSDRRRLSLRPLRPSALTCARAPVRGQTAFRTGQDITPAFDGWEANPDGTFNLVFGYFNRNWDEELDIPIGPTNNVEPGGPDQGQPTHFFPRRNRYVFRVQGPEGLRQEGNRLDADGATGRRTRRTRR